MTARALVPPAMAGGGLPGMSPGIASHGHVAVSGMTGADPDGTMQADPEAQVRAARTEIGTVLSEAGLTLADGVETIPCGLGLAGHVDLFARIRAEVLAPAAPPGRRW